MAKENNSSAENIVIDWMQHILVYVDDGLFADDKKDKDKCLSQIQAYCSSIITTLEHSKCS